MAHGSEVSANDFLGSRADFCFVAMDFGPGFTPVYEEILAPAIVDCGMRPVRGDTFPSSADDVVDEIVSLIQAARVVLVDITGSNPNVMIELGIAHALKKNI